MTSGRVTASINWGAITRWRLSCVPLDDMPSVEHPGSMLRGAFGHALRKLACTCGAGADHEPTCLYLQIFDPQPSRDLPGRFRDVPPAFVITPPHHGVGNPRGFTFWMTLLGPALQHQELILASLREAGSTGLGPKLSTARIDREAVEDLPPIHYDANEWLLQLTSPMFLKRNGRPISLGSLEPQDLPIALHRRLALVDSLYPLGIRLPPVAEWIAEASTWSLKKMLDEVRFSRYSSRQNASMPLQGIRGSILIEHQISRELLEGLSLGQWLHLGGKTSQGLGAYRLTSVDHTPA